MNKLNSWDKCKNCGGERGLHQYQTMQCPVGGVEAPGLRKQEWMTLTFQMEDDSAARIAELEAALTSIDALLEEDMGEWYSVSYEYLPTSYSNRAHIRDHVAELLEAK
jgi:hypothetical protein